VTSCPSSAAPIGMPWAATPRRFPSPTAGTDLPVRR
jgi:hypothetical protein